MCGILGVFGRGSTTQVKSGLPLLKLRGKDGFSVEKVVHKDTLVGCVAHSLHSVVSVVKQPIHHKGMLIANCEIYNWQKLVASHSLRASNDADILCLMLDKFGVKAFPRLDGVYAFAYVRDGKVWLARDIMGEKPLWYAHTSTHFAFASEKKMLVLMGYEDVVELNPRQYLEYTISHNSLRLVARSFFQVGVKKETTLSYPEIKRKTRLLLEKAIDKRVLSLSHKFGLLFSGGVDSAFLAYYLKSKGYTFTCYVTAVTTPDLTTTPIDLVQAQSAAVKLGLDLKVVSISILEYEEILKKVVPLIEDSNPIKVGVAVPFYAASRVAAQDGCKVILSGLGSEEIFAGYDRHKQSSDINSECLSGLRKMYERDLYRDDVVTINNGVELRLPFLDAKLIRFALTIPSKYKLCEHAGGAASAGVIGKFVFRDLACDMGLPSEIAWAKKVAAQYGSKSDYALEKLARRGGFVSKAGYLRSLYAPYNLRVGVLFSGGKDSTYAAYILARQNYNLTCLLHMASHNLNSYMFQTAGIEVVPLQAQAMSLPLIVQDTNGVKEKELVDLKKLILRAKDEYHIDAIVTGAVGSTYQRNRIEKICEKIGVKVFAPLWHKDSKSEMEELLSLGFDFTLSAIAAEGLSLGLVGRSFTQADLGRLIAASRKVPISLNGEGGEFESIVLDCPLFLQRLILDEIDVVRENSCTAHLVVKKAHLEPKLK